MRRVMDPLDRTYEKTIEDGLGISRNAIRELVLTGQLPCVRIGKKRLINYNVLLALLQTGTIENTKQENVETALRR